MGSITPLPWVMPFHRQNLGEGLSPDQGATYPPSPNPEEPSTTNLPNFDRPLEDAVLYDPSLAATFDASEDLDQMQPTPLERSHRDTTPELKFQTFRKKPQFDTFRPRPAVHIAKFLPSSMLAITGDTLRKLRRACAPPALYS